MGNFLRSLSMLSMRSVCTCLCWARRACWRREWSRRSWPSSEPCTRSCRRTTEHYHSTIHNSSAILGQILKITSTADCFCSVLIFVSMKIENTMKTTKWWLSAVTWEKMFDHGELSTSLMWQNMTTPRSHHTRTLCLLWPPSYCDCIFYSWPCICWPRWWPARWSPWAGWRSRWWRPRWWGGTPGSARLSALCNSLIE